MSLLEKIVFCFDKHYFR